MNEFNCIIMRVYDSKSPTKAIIQIERYSPNTHAK